MNNFLSAFNFSNHSAEAFGSKLENYALFYCLPVVDELYCRLAVAFQPFSYIYFAECLKGVEKRQQLENENENYISLKTAKLAI